MEGAVADEAGVAADELADWEGVDVAYRTVLYPLEATPFLCSQGSTARNLRRFFEGGLERGESDETQSHTTARELLRPAASIIYTHVYSA